MAEKRRFVAPIEARPAVVWALLATIVLGSGCRKTAPPRAQAPQVTVADAAVPSSTAKERVKMPMEVRIVGPRANFSGLRAVPGVMVMDHSAEQIDGDTWALTTYVNSEDAIPLIEAKGLQVEVLLTAEQVAERSQRIANKVGDGGTS
jgi:hypothetical protein